MWFSPSRQPGQVAIHWNYHRLTEKRCHRARVPSLDIGLLFLMLDWVFWKPWHFLLQGINNMGANMAAARVNSKRAESIMTDKRPLLISHHHHHQINFSQYNININFILKHIYFPHRSADHIFSFSPFRPFLTLPIPFSLKNYDSSSTQ